MNYLKTIFVIVVVIVIGIYLIGNYYAIHPESCLKCHSMKPYYESWKSSMHSVAAKSCIDCHLRGSFIQGFLFRFQVLNEMFFTKENEKPPQGVYLPATESCVKTGCHSMNRIRNTSNTLKIDHNLHSGRMKISCSECHKGVVHTGVSGLDGGLPKARLCMKCHASQSLTCDYCHLKPVDKNFRH